MSSSADLEDLLGRQEEPRDDLATTALVLGVLSLVLSVLTGVPALVAGLVGLARSRRRGSGAVRSAVAVLLGAGSVVVAVLVVQAVAPVVRTVQAVGAVPAEDLLVAGSPQARAGAVAAAQVLEQVGVDPASLDCGSPAAGLDVTLTCAARRPGGEAVEVVGSCPASLVTGEAVCTVDLTGSGGTERREVRVVLRDGVPELALLPR